MQKINVTINLYSINDLNGKARQRAIDEHYNFLVSQGMEVENQLGALVVEDYSPNEDEVVENIEANDYLYFVDGELASVVTFCGKHPRAGQSEFTFKNVKQTFYI